MEARAPDTVGSLRLLLRPWRAADRAPFAVMNADPEVMRHIGSGVLDRVGSHALVRRFEDEWRREGRGVWAVERREDGRFLGFCGLSVPSFLPQVLPAVEIGWRLERGAWGAGYATEAARTVLECAWGRLGLAQVIALVHPENDRSLAVAERLGMRVTGKVRHAPTGWDVLVLRCDRPVGHPSAAGQV